MSSLSAFFLVVLLSVALACSPSFKVVKLEGFPLGPSPWEDRYSLEQVETHFSAAFTEYDRPSKRSFQCVDARGTELAFGTPGGDAAEIATAIVCSWKIRHLQFNRKSTSE